MRGLIIGLHGGLILWAIILAAVFGMGRFVGPFVTLVGCFCLASFLSWGIARLAWEA